MTEERSSAEAAMFAKFADRYERQIALTQSALPSPADSSVRACVFDLGGVVLGSPFKGIAAYEEANDVPHNYVNAVIVGNGANGAFQRMERGEIDRESFHRLFNAELKSSFSLKFYEDFANQRKLKKPTLAQKKFIESAKLDAEEIFSKMLKEAETFNPLFVHMLFVLRGLGYKLAALTNNFSPMEKDSPWARKLNDVFDYVVESSVEKKRKPNEEFYLVCTSKLGVSPSECVFFDDIRANVDAAAKLGMKAFRVKLNQSIKAAEWLGKLLFKDANFFLPKTSRPITVKYPAGVEGGELVCDVFGDASKPIVLLLHGGGQTRHSWAKTCVSLAEAGFCAICVDQKGHGQSYWDRHTIGRRYLFFNYAEDLDRLVVAMGLAHARPCLCGASLGGLAIISSSQAKHSASCVVLVDVTPKLERSGVERILSFMRESVVEGFESLEDAALKVSAYNPQREQSKLVTAALAKGGKVKEHLLEGLKKNLRKVPSKNGDRWTFHYDGVFIMERDLDVSATDPEPGSSMRSQEGLDLAEAVLSESAREIMVPTLLIRGRQTDLVSLEGAKRLKELLPHSQYADVQAGHVVAGDSNDAFTGELLKFLKLHHVSEKVVAKL